MELIDRTTASDEEFRARVKRFERGTELSADQWTLDGWDREDADEDER